MQKLTEIRPARKALVFDLVREAGMDMSDWENSSNDPRGPKTNPKYCYEWSFVEPGKMIILNLWHNSMIEEDSRVVLRNNFRADAEFHRTTSRKSSWAKRAGAADAAIRTALEESLPVRVIINDGLMRDRFELSKPSRVTARSLDPEPWTITRYDHGSGEVELARGIFDTRFVDQFGIDQAGKAVRTVEVNGKAYVRDPSVRRAVLYRAGGHCEFCGAAGFRMESGAVYLETHHVVPLSDSGDDSIGNVVALCANDHRMAHFGEAA